MKKIVLFPFRMRVPMPSSSLLRFSANALIHISATGPCCNCVYSCNIPVIGLMTSFGSKWLYDSCAVKIFMSRLYLEAALSLLGGWRSRDCRGYIVSVCGTTRDGAVTGICDGTTLGDGAVVGIGDAPLGGDVVGAPVGRYVASITCSVLMVCICLSPTANGNDGAVLLSASTRSSTDWRGASVEKSFGTGQLCGKH